MVYLKTNKLRQTTSSLLIFLEAGNKEPWRRSSGI
jgi:hypothetical protein